jgi:hypothetical protein
MPTINTNGYFYSIYKEKNQAFSEETFACAERTVGNLLHVATSSDHPGMLLGKVQSGKTRTFISILAAAFDNGFDIAIVLSKNSKALIEQTTKRLHSEFSFFVDEGELDIHDIMHAPVAFEANELESKLIFVAKKQSDNLRRLIELFSQKCPMMAQRRVLIIDDEADNASIGYTKKQDLIEANKIADQISELRKAIQQTSFLQVTATPYSLYLQPAEIEVANSTSFSPTRPLFTELVPVPPEYVGGDTYFGEAARSQDDTLQSLIHYTVDPREFDRLKRPDRRGFKKEDALISPAIQGYRHAIVNFIVGGCIQRINGTAQGINPKKLRYSFLLHSEAGKDAHNWQEEITIDLKDQLKVVAENNDPSLESLILASYDDLKRSVIADGKPLPDFPTVLEAARKGFTDGQISIKKVNSDDDVASLLDNSGQLKLSNYFNIFIGGQVIDRGVTLANLIGFYYGRRPQKYQQDTVLQHSRMYGYRRADLCVTRFYTSTAIRFAMFQMEEFDSTLRGAIDAGGNRAVQFISRAADGSIVPCSPNKILVASTQTLRPFKRILPIGFQTGFRTGQNAISKSIDGLDTKIVHLCGFNADAPALVPVATALEILSLIETTMNFPEDDAPPFDWDAARAALCHLCQQHPDPAERGKVFLWAARDRKSARMASPGSHATYIETPDSEKTEGKLARDHAINHPILFLLRQDGEKEKGWNDTPFYWPIIRAQRNTPTAVYTSDTIS